MIALDGGRAFNGGNPPAELSFRDARIPNPRKDSAAADDSRRRAEGLVQGPAQALDGDVENLGQFARRARLARRPAEPARRPDQEAVAGRTLTQFCGTGDYGTAYAERAEIYDLVRDAKITGFAIVSGDRHSFWAGYATSNLPPRQVRAGWPELRRRVARQPGRDGSA